MRRGRRLPSLRLPRRPWQALLLVVFLLALAALQQWRPELFQRPAPRVLESGAYRVARVVDGDTLVLADPAERVRLIGADTPETVKPNWPVEPWGPEASAFTRKFLSGGEVRLEFDDEPRDKYGRILAYVWVGDRMLNEELIRAGLARAELQYHYSAAHKARFRRAEAAARTARRGIWSAENKTTDEHG
jgi:micrococcal nuclease